MTYKLITLYSGSKGNSVFLCAADTKILIDAGKSAKALCAALCSVGESIEDIEAIFITHEHSDHTAALDTLCRRHDIPVHMTALSARKFDRCDLCEHITRHQNEFCEQVGGLTVKAFRTPHDSNMSVGYRIEFDDSEGHHAIGVATDIGYVTDNIRGNLEGCEAVVLEANHDTQMLKDGRYPDYLKARILSKRGHLSNTDSALLAAHLADRGTRGFLLAHLSEENNLPELAYDEVCAAISDERVRVCVACPDAPTELVLAGIDIGTSTATVAIYKT